MKVLSDIILCNISWILKILLKKIEDIAFIVNKVAREQLCQEKEWPSTQQTEQQPIQKIPFGRSMFVFVCLRACMRACVCPRAEL